MSTRGIQRARDLVRAWYPTQAEGGLEADLVMHRLASGRVRKHTAREIDLIREFVKVLRSSHMRQEPSRVADAVETLLDGKGIPSARDD